MQVKYFLIFIALSLYTLFPGIWSGQATTPPYPQRIISLGPINTENVFLLGAGDRLIANTSYCVRPEAAKKKEKIGSVMQVTIEKIIGLHPDLVLATGLTQKLQLRQLQAAGIKVVQFDQPTSFSDICEQFLKLGKLLGLKDRSEQIIADAKRNIAKVQKLTSMLPGKKVFLQVGAEPLFSSVPTSFTNDFIVLAGGINIARKQQSGITNYEKVIAADPDVIIIAMMGSESGIAAKEQKKWLSMSVISAAKQKRVFVINPDLICSPSPATFVETLTVIASLIPPELLDQISPDK